MGDGLLLQTYDPYGFNPVYLQPPYAAPTTSIAGEAAFVVGGYGVDQPQQPVVEADLSIDMPTFKSLPGTVISIFLTMIAVSVFICVGRTDFSLVFYLLGYYIWCVDAEALRILPRDSPTNTSYQGSAATILPGVHKGGWTMPYICSRRMYKSVQYLAALLAFASFVDVSWLFIAFATWTYNDTEDTGKDIYFANSSYRMDILLPMHKFVLILSVVNLTLKVLATILCVIWSSQQSKHVQSEDSSWSVHQSM